MGGCEGTRSTDNPYDDDCSRIELLSHLPEFQYKQYIVVLTKYTFMGSLTAAQLANFCQDLKISKKEYESNATIKGFFEEFKEETNKTYDDFCLKGAGLFYCQGSFSEKSEAVKFLLDPDNTGKIPKERLRILLAKLVDLSVIFTAKQIAERNTDGKTAKELSRITAEQKDQIVRKWFPLPAEDEFECKVLTEWIEKGSFNPSEARKIAMNNMVATAAGEKPKSGDPVTTPTTTEKTKGADQVIAVDNNK